VADRRTCARRAGFAAALAAPFAGACGAQPLSIVFRNTAPLASSTTDQFGNAFAITGLSGIAFRAVDSDGRCRFLAVMDNSNHLIDIAVTFASGGSISSVWVVGGFTVAESRDFEGIAVMAPAAHSVLLAEEGTPALREYSLSSGGLLGTFPTPAVYFGRRDNFGFESAARGPGGAEYWTVNEEAIVADGPLSTPSAGTWVRILRYDAPSGAPAPAEQFAYQTAPMHGSAITGGRSGVSELVALPGGRLLTLERSLAGPFPSFQSRIYELTVAGATDVSSLASLAGQAFTPAGKTMLYRGNQANMEGLCLGPPLAPGAWSLVGIVDDGDHIFSTNRLVAFALSGLDADAPCPADFDGNAFVNGDDFDLFVERFVAGDPSADVDLNGFVNGDDFDAFTQGFVSGC